MKKIRLLFVCLGNICRSPTAEAVMNSILKKEGLDQFIECDSAGTSSVHQGETADPRTITHAEERGHRITSLSRPFMAVKDFDEFDYIITMDDDNFNNVLQLDTLKKQRDKIYKMVQFSSQQKYTQVPDPYFEGPDGFELVLDILEDSCLGLLSKIKDDHNL